VGQLGLVLLVIFGISSSSFAQKTSCQKLTADLTSMQNAQKALLASFVKKNKMLAESLEAHSEKVDSKTSLKLKRSADVFRQHEIREAQLVERFEKASAQLIGQVQECLDASSRLSSR